MIKRILWVIVRCNDSGNPYVSCTNKRNRMGWIAWDLIDSMSSGFDGLE